MILNCSSMKHEVIWWFESSSDRMLCDQFFLLTKLQPLFFFERSKICYKKKL